MAISDLFELNENNYSVQHIIISLGRTEKYFNKLINNIDKFKVLKNLIIKDYINKFDNLLGLVQNLSRLDLLKTVKLYYKGVINYKALKLISKSIPNIYYWKKVNSDITEFIFHNNKN